MDNLHKKSKIRNDVILIAVLLVIFFLSTFLFFINKESGKKVIVSIDGEKYAEYSLEDNITVKIQTNLNSDEFNLLIISNGEAEIVEASCPDLICANHAPIKFEGESIICLPNKVVVAIE